MVPAIVSKVWNVPPLEKIEPGPVFVIAGKRYGVKDVLQLDNLLCLARYLELINPNCVVDLDLQEVFSGGVYFRTITIPAGSFIFGKTHLTEHTNILFKGSMELYMNDGRPTQTITGPLMFPGHPGDRKTAYTYSDCVYMNTFKTTENLGLVKEES